MLTSHQRTEEIDAALTTCKALFLTALLTALSALLLFLLAVTRTVSALATLALATVSLALWVVSLWGTGIELLLSHIASYQQAMKVRL
jgi:hypothetical protein